MTANVSKWDASEYLETEEDIAEYLNAIIEENGPALLQEALGDVAKTRGMSGIARDADVGLLYETYASNPKEQARPLEWGDSLVWMEIHQKTRYPYAID
ncbi:addiction module antidote protein [Curtanaerobium respiraculi]|uniref:addiction module antidote protein n=1 Tax=Curtanaerobium respiraculi TaxID=2949669 RepID=UPI0024B39EE6|nr:addiction module antidote protein [Curtanaerobium respiraculi]